MLSLLKKNSLWLLSVLVLLAVVWQLIAPIRAQEGMWIVFDDVHTVRIQEMVHELSVGQFPVRMLQRLGNGAGYLLFNFYSPLVYYAGAVLVFLGTSPLNAGKLLFQLAYIWAALGSFLFFISYYRKHYFAALAGAVLLITSTYFNYDVFTRGALGELWGFATMPWIFFSYYWFRQKQTLFFGLLFASFLALQFYLHAIAAVITLPILALRFLFDVVGGAFTSKHWRLFAAVGMAYLGLVASAALPIVFEKSAVQYSQAEFVTEGFEHGYIDFNELIGMQRSEDRSILPITLGIFLVVLTTYALGSLLRAFIVEKQKHFPTDEAFFLVSLVFLFFIMTPLSSWLWEASSFLQLTQFPYRFVSITTFVCIWLVVYALENLGPLFTGIIAVAIISGSFKYNAEFMEPKGFYFADEFIAQDPCNTTTWQAEYLPSVTQLCLQSDSDKIATASGALEVRTAQVNDAQDTVEVTTNGKAGTLIIRKYAYPGWTISSNQRTIPVEPYGMEGLVSGRLEESDVQVTVAFKNTKIRSVADKITLFSVMAVLVLLLRSVSTMLFAYKKRTNETQ